MITNIYYSVDRWKSINEINKIRKAIIFDPENLFYLIA